MDLREMFLKFFPAISAMFKMGFIPSPDEIYELTGKQYASYQKQGGDVSKRLYAIIPKNYKYLASMPSNELSILTEVEVTMLGMAALFLYQYAQEGGCNSEKSDDVLRFAAERLPTAFTKGTEFERPILKELKPGEIHLTAQDEWKDLLATVMGEGGTLEMKLTNPNTKESEKISIPLEKLR